MAGLLTIACNRHTQGQLSISTDVYAVGRQTTGSRVHCSFLTLHTLCTRSVSDQYVILTASSASMPSAADSCFGACKCPLWMAETQQLNRDCVTNDSHRSPSL
ncbi:hypothetical protein ABBQ32_008789 [Trebouxia sp. C0010 RCD-2024]